MMAGMSLPLIVVTTVASVEQERALARTLVEQQLAACVQINPIDSVYRWQGAVHEDAEFRLLCKTSAARAPALMAAIRQLHPYELPALHAVALALADPAYAQWIEDSTRDPG